jgi:aminomethyltransferase
MEVRELSIISVPCIVVRSGYTGEDGFEISTPADVGREIAEALLENKDVAPIGLGARDSLRLEAGLCLYGSDIDTSTTPVEAGLSWVIQKARQSGGAREGGFPGAIVILDQIKTGTQRRRVGLRPEGRAPVRAGALLFVADQGGEPAGTVTSGGFGPSAEAPVAMGYLPAALAEVGKRIFAEVRGKRLPVTVAALPFIPHRYKRG